MKILFLVNHLSFGGAERTVSYLSSYLAESGEKVVIYTMTNLVRYQINNKVKIVCGNLPTKYNGRLGRYRNIVQRTMAINCIIQREKPDLVFSIIANTAKYLLINRKRSYKLIVSERANPKYLPVKEYELEKKVFEQADGIVFQTERVKDNYIGLYEGKSAVIPNAVGNALVYETNWNPNCRKSIVAVGRLDPQKDYFVMIEAFRRFLSIHPGFQLEIYGEGQEKEAIRKYIMENNLEGTVVLGGYFQM